MLNLICTTQAEHLAQKLKGHPGINIVFLDKNKENARYFPDDEVYVRIKDLDKLRGRVVVLHSGAPHHNSGLIELEMVLQLLKDAKIKSEVFFSYFGYGQQDKVWYDGEVCFTRSILEKLVKYYGVKKMYVVDAHFSYRDWVKKYQLVNISVLDLLIKQVDQNNPNYVFLSPDLGSQLRTGLAGLDKNRLDSFNVAMTSDDHFEALVKGKIVVVVDDILETGGTLIKFYEKCKEHGAKEVIALVTHGILESGITRVQKVYSKLYLTNTIDRPQANVDISQKIIDNLL